MRFTHVTFYDRTIPMDRLAVRSPEGAWKRLDFIRKHRTEWFQVHRCLDWLEYHRHPDEPGAWDLLMALFPRDKDTLEGMALAIAQDRLERAAGLPEHIPF